MDKWMNELLTMKSRLQRQASENRWPMRITLNFFLLLKLFFYFLPYPLLSDLHVYVSSNLQTTITLPQMHLTVPCIFYLFILHKSIPLAIWKTRTTLLPFKFLLTNLFSTCYCFWYNCAQFHHQIYRALWPFFVVFIRNFHVKTLKKKQLKSKARKLHCYRV